MKSSDPFSREEIKLPSLRSIDKSINCFDSLCLPIDCATFELL